MSPFPFLCLHQQGLQGLHQQGHRSSSLFSTKPVRWIRKAEYTFRKESGYGRYVGCHLILLFTYYLFTPEAMGRTEFRNIQSRKPGEFTRKRYLLQNIFFLTFFSGLLSRSSCYFPKRSVLFVTFSILNAPTRSSSRSPYPSSWAVQSIQPASPPGGGGLLNLS